MSDLRCRITITLTMGLDPEAETDGLSPAQAAARDARGLCVIHEDGFDIDWSYEIDSPGPGETWEELRRMAAP